MSFGNKRITEEEQLKNAQQIIWVLKNRTLWFSSENRRLKCIGWVSRLHFHGISLERCLKTALFCQKTFR